MNQLDENTLWYHAHLDVFLNHWFSNYEAAKEAREREGEFLLPFKNHFYVCKAEVIDALGVASDDPDWEKIGWDAARPLDEEAYERLREKRQIVLDNLVQNRER